MIPRIHARGISSAEALAEALGRPVSDEEGLTTDHTVVAYWPGLDHYTLDDEQKIWTSATWAEHLDDPNWQYPFAASEQDDRCAIWHADVRLHPDDRTLTGPEWSEIAHRLARTAGIATPGDDQGCRWIAVQARPGRLDLLANLVRLDGEWQRQDAHLPRRLVAEARRIEADLRLRAPEEAHVHRAPGPEAASVAGQLAQVLFQITDERSGPLATVRGLVEHASQRLSGLPQSYGPETGIRLELAAARLHALQRDLEHAAIGLTEQARLAPAGPLQSAAPPAPGARRTR